MLTPQEAEAHVFPKASFGGYNMLQVDTFLDSLIADYRTIYQENLALKSKMKILVDKVEEYRATEDAMRRTLHSAQKEAEALIQEGEAQKQAALSQLQEETARRRETIQAQLVQEEEAAREKLDSVKSALANEELRLSAAKAATVAYVNKLKELYTQELTYIGSLSELTADAPGQAEEPAPEAQPEPAAAPAQPEATAEEEGQENTKE